MATATCWNCGKDTHWRATRGARLADVPCTHCGQRSLKGKTAGRQNPNHGERMEACSVCGRRAFKFIRPTMPWMPRWANVHPELARIGRTLDNPFPAGWPACSVHEPTLVDPRQHAYDELGDRVGREAERGVCAFCGKPKGEHG